MAKLCHPDHGGSEELMSMLGSFKELMDSLSKIKIIIEYEEKIEAYKIEYSSPKINEN